MDGAPARSGSPATRHGAEWEHWIIDWTDATLGDRHFDVARTLALFTVASLERATLTTEATQRVPPELGEQLAARAANALADID